MHDKNQTISGRFFVLFNISLVDITSYCVYYMKRVIIGSVLWYSGSLALFLVVDFVAGTTRFLLLCIMEMGDSASKFSANALTNKDYKFRHEDNDSLVWCFMLSFMLQAHKLVIQCSRCTYAERTALWAPQFTFT